MPETKVIDTQTQLNISGSNIGIFTSYNTGLPNLIEALIANSVGDKNGTNFKEGEGIITMKNSPAQIDCFLDSNGNLFITAEDAENYALDSSGNLIYSTP